MTEDRVYTLADISKEITKLIPNKKYIIESEVSSVSNRRGITYFDFKENKNSLAGIIFNNDKKFNNGDKIKCSGKLSFYAPFGKISFNVDNIIDNSGVGNHLQEFIDLKEKLKNKKYFEKKRKKIINGLIEDVIIITSEKGAAIHDIYRNLSNHDSNVKITLKDAPVQGIRCHLEISNIIDSFNENNNKIIIITRGGGDYQDLNGFNQEILVDSIYHSKNIIISAIGHETDTVLSDLVSDYTLPTPSLVAQFIIDHNNDIINEWDNTINNLQHSIIDKINENVSLLKDFDNNILIEENNFSEWINLIENTIVEQLYNRQVELNEYYNYLDSTGEIKLFDKNKNAIVNLQNFITIFSDNQFYIQIKNNRYKISNFDYETK